jgi:hypothetical protein
MCDQTWFILREPGLIPERKGPINEQHVKGFLIELMAARPAALITVLRNGDAGPDVQDGP